LLVAIAAGDSALVRASLDAAPALATARLPRRDEFFIDHRHVQVYEGATALHAAAFAYDRETAEYLVARGAGVRARDRRGAEPRTQPSSANPAHRAGTRRDSGRSSSTWLTRAPTRTPPPWAA
jgi:hypothetical protein